MIPMAALTMARLSPDDIDSVSVIEAEAGDVAWSRAQFEKELTLPMSRFFVMREGANILGYGGFWNVQAEAQITNLVVLPSARRRGKGIMILQHLMAEARHEGCQVMTLEVRGQNLAAQALYAKAGFTARGRRPRMYTAPVDDAILMEKTL